MEPQVTDEWYLRKTKERKELIPVLPPTPEEQDAALLMDMLINHCRGKKGSRERIERAKILAEYIIKGKLIYIPETYTSGAPNPIHAYWLSIKSIISKL